MTSSELTEAVLGGALASGGAAVGVRKHRKDTLHRKASEHVEALAEVHGWDETRKAIEVANLKRRKMR